MLQSSPVKHSRESVDPIVMLIEYLIEETHNKSQMTSSMLRVARLAYIEEGQIET